MNMENTQELLFRYSPRLLHTSGTSFRKNFPTKEELRDFLFWKIGTGAFEKRGHFVNAMTDDIFDFFS